MASPQQHFDAARQWQEYYQKEVGDEIGFQVPAPTLGQSTNDYRREMMRLLKKTFVPPDHNLSRVNMRGLPDAALQGIQESLIPAAKEGAYDPRTVPQGELRQITKIDSRSGHKMNVFVGRESFVRQLTRRGRKVKSFLFDPRSIRS